MHIQGIFHEKLSYHIDGALTGLFFCRNRVIFYYGAKRNHWSLDWFSKSPFILCFPILQEVLDITQVAVTFHRISPPFFIQAGLQQCRRSSLFFSAYRSRNNTVFPGSMGCGCTTIPGELSSFANFQGIVSLNDIGLFRRLEKPS